MKIERASLFLNIFLKVELVVFVEGLDNGVREKERSQRWPKVLRHSCRLLGTPLKTTTFPCRKVDEPRDTSNAVPFYCLKSSEATVALPRLLTWLTKALHGLAPNSPGFSLPSPHLASCSPPTMTFSSSDPRILLSSLPPHLTNTCTYVWFPPGFSFFFQELALFSFMSFCCVFFIIACVYPVIVLPYFIVYGFF